MPALYDVPVNTIDGRAATLADHKGKVLLIVNVASKCGLTPQYEGLEKLQKTYAAKGFSVLGFPANNFGAQEPGTNDEIQSFCSTNYGVSFPLYEKISVRGDGMHPLYQELVAGKPKAQMKPGGTLMETLTKHGLAPKTETEVAWNFEKFLVGRDGKVAARFAPDYAPDDTTITKAIESELAR
ncbi:MAG TPA: glutathione peroxidase [Rhizomicrobium sp.]|nr:glutathione peroxidase [Rhizomicrobium sp.]